MTGVTVTGIGLVTPIGSTLDEMFEALCTGRSGLRRPPAGHPVHGSLDVAGLAPDLDARTVLPGTEARTVDRYIVMALVAADAALADAGVVAGVHVDPYRVATVINGAGGLATLSEQVLERSRRGRFGVSPYLLPGMLPNMGAARVTIRHGLRGYSTSHGNACAAGGQAIAEAVRLIRSGAADVVVCGSSEAPLFPTLVDTFGNARTLARGWADDPAAASRPFDRRRNGLVLAEGAGVLVVERSDFAAARGATGYADVLGWGATSDAYHPTTPRPDGTGAAACMTSALRDAGLEPADVGYLNAHGTGTKLGDIAEAAAIRLAFGGHAPPVSSCKAVTGHLLGASGVLEAAACIAALRDGLLPPTHNLDDPDPACELDHIRKAPRRSSAGAVLSNSFGFGGHNVSVVLGHPSIPRHRPARQLPAGGPAPITGEPR
jgi:3-oxoacyl-[acyl-carrier-protein] synthase II